MGKKTFFCSYLFLLYLNSTRLNAANKDLNADNPH